MHLEEVEVASEIKVLSGGITNSAVAIDPVVRQCRIGPQWKNSDQNWSPLQKILINLNLTEAAGKTPEGCPLTFLAWSKKKSGIHSFFCERKTFRERTTFWFWRTLVMSSLELLLRGVMVTWSESSCWGVPLTWRSRLLACSFGTTLGPLWDNFGTTLRQLWDNFETILKQVGDNFETD